MTYETTYRQWRSRIWKRVCWTETNER
jgi:hypothetical protein